MGSFYFRFGYHLGPMEDLVRKTSLCHSFPDLPPVQSGDRNTKLPPVVVTALVCCNSSSRSSSNGDSGSGSGGSIPCSDRIRHRNFRVIVVLNGIVVIPEVVVVFFRNS